jgi:hypothetical protein
MTASLLTSIIYQVSVFFSVYYLEFHRLLLLLIYYCFPVCVARAFLESVCCATCRVVRTFLWLHSKGVIHLVDSGSIRIKRQQQILDSQLHPRSTRQVAQHTDSRNARANDADMFCIFGIHFDLISARMLNYRVHSWQKLHNVYNIWYPITHSLIIVLL